jgi:hypothetical protein
MEDRGRHRIGISQNQPHINADVVPQKYNETEVLLQENARRMVAMPVFEGFANLKLNLTNVIGVAGTVAKETAAK